MAISAQHPNLEIIWLLLEAGADDEGKFRFGRREALDAVYESRERVDLREEQLRHAMEIASKHSGTSLRSLMQQGMLESALGNGNLELVKFLQQMGVDLTFVDEFGNDALLLAVRSSREDFELVQYLIESGLPLDHKNNQGDTPITLAAKFDRYDIVAELIRHGVDDAPLQWTSMSKSLAMGAIEEVTRGLKESPNAFGFDVLRICLSNGDLELVKLLVEHGVSLQPKYHTLNLALESGNIDLVRWLVEQGLPADELEIKVVCERGNLEFVRQLLQLGANPNVFGDYELSLDRDMIRLLIAFGADPSDLHDSCRRTLLGIDKPYDGSLDRLTRDEYLASWQPREGVSNPEDITDPFRLAMFRGGGSACGVAWSFNEKFNTENIIPDIVGSSHWCAQRFGQSVTILPDGRFILIAGEHEDGGMPGFCIYNDVIVCHPDGEIKIYGYPYDVFPPTDFHSATLVGDSIYIIGSLGYNEAQRGLTPVWRLSTETYQIEWLPFDEGLPGKINSHRAELIVDKFIRVTGGKIIQSKGALEVYAENRAQFFLDLETLKWTEAAGPRIKSWDM